MKTLFRTLLAATLLLITPPPPAAHALFGHVAAEKDRRIHTEEKLDQQENANEHLHLVVSVLSAGIVIALIIGAAIGSKTRRDANQR